MGFRLWFEKKKKNVFDSLSMVRKYHRMLDATERDKLIPTLVWRGSNYPFIKTQPEGMSDQESNEHVKEAILGLYKRGSPVTAKSILEHLRLKHMDRRISPRFIAALMSVVGKNVYRYHWGRSHVEKKQRNPTTRCAMKTEPFFFFSQLHSPRSVLYSYIDVNP